MPVLAFALETALLVYLWLFIARFFIDLVRSFNPSFRPKGLVLVLLEIVMTLTDPPLKLVRRFIKPVRVGSIALDFGWTAVVLAITLLQGLIGRFL
jgi:YggT family protein